MVVKGLDAEREGWVTYIGDLTPHIESKVGGLAPCVDGVTHT